MIYSGGDRIEDYALAIAMGAKAYYPKPFDYEDVEKTVLSMLSHMQQ